MTDVARRNDVVRQTVHDWLRRYATDGLTGLADVSSKPQSCPHDGAGGRGRHPRAAPGPSRLGPSQYRPPSPARRRGAGLGRSSIYRCLVRHGLITPQARKRRSDYKRWERSRTMELWQMDIVGGVILSGGREAKIVTGVDDHSQFCVSGILHETGETETFGTAGDFGGPQRLGYRLSGSAVALAPTPSATGYWTAECPRRRLQPR